MLLADDKIWDQNGFNDILHTQLGPSVDDDSGLVYTFDGKLKLGILPASIFCSGHTYFVQVGTFQLTISLIEIFSVYFVCAIHLFSFMQLTVWRDLEWTRGMIYIRV